jgi:hypothetical protein
MPQQSPTDPLDDLRERVRATQDAAERLAADAARSARAQAEGGIPPAGWATPHERATTRDELQEIASLLRVLRDAVPPELQAQLTEVLRQVLLLVRGLLDYWVERLEPAGAGAGVAAADGPLEAQDIPIA